MPFDPSGKPTVCLLAEPGVLIGRQEDCDLVLESPFVSRMHARVAPRNGAWWVFDRGSTHGTFVNGERIRERALAPGDEIGIGAFRLQFDAAENALRVFEPSAVTTSLEDDAEIGATTTPGIRIDELLPEEPDVVGTFAPRESPLLALVRMSDGIHRCNDMATLCRVVVETALRATRGDRGVIALRNAKGEYVPRAEMEARRGTLVSGSVKVSRTFVDRVLREKTGMIAQDAGRDVALSRSIVALDIKSMVCVPLLDGTDVLGWLYLDRVGIGKGFAVDDLDVLSLLGLQAASAASRLTHAHRARAQEAQRARLSRFLSADVVRHIEEEAKNGVVDPLASARAQTVTVLFSDIRGFTALSEVADPADLKRFLDAYFDRMTEILVDRHGGTLDKFMGDGLMALFGAPFSKGAAEDARSAVAAALDMASGIHEVRQNFQQYGQLQIRIGINTGRVIAGMIGSSRRLEYSVLGDAVNVASRLEGAAPPGGILIGEATHALIGEGFVCESAGDLKFKNRAKAVHGWRVVRASVRD